MRRNHHAWLEPAIHLHHRAVDHSRNGANNPFFINHGNQHSIINFANHTWHHRNSRIGSDPADIHHEGIGRLARNDSSWCVLHT